MLDHWRRPAAGSASPLRTCFRLTPPSPDEEATADLSPASARGTAAPARNKRTTTTSVIPPAAAAVARAAPPPAGWSLEFLLQPVSDPSLLVPAGEVWRSGPALASLGTGGEDPREKLLSDLGHASRLLPELDAALEEARPDALALSTEGAYRFLSEAAPVLEQAGFGVLVPPWWRSRGARLGLRVKVAPKTAEVTADNGLGLDGLCDYGYEVALGDAVLTEAELRELARLKAPLVRTKGRWVELRREDLEAALDLLKRQRTSPFPPLPALDLVRLGLGLAPAELPVVAMEATGWLGELLSADAAGFEARPTPAGFCGVLRPYQQRGLGWLAWLDRFGLGACLADDMGLGKTAQLLGLLLLERENGSAADDGAKQGRPRRIATRARGGKTAPSARGPGPTLLVCPMSVVGNWQREAARFAPSVPVHVHHGAARLTGAGFAKAVEGAGLVVTTYNLLARDAEMFAGVQWRRLVLDEAQYVKNPETRQARAARTVPARRRVALTGTPVENHLSELWSIMDILNPGLLGGRQTFRKRFSVPIEREGDEEAAGLLRRVTRPFVLRRLKTDSSIISDLPDKLEMKVFCNLTREQATLYQAVVDDMLARVDQADGMKRKGIVLASLTKLKQVCNHPAQLLGDGSALPGRSGKLSQLEDVVDDVVEVGERLLCFTQFAEMGEMVRDHLQARLGVAVPFLHGGVSKPKRDAMVEAFQAGDAGQVLVLSLKAGGVGLNLTAANHVVHYDRWWNPAVEDQATDRAFRIGQGRNVQVRKFVCVGTVEERIDAMIERKRALAERIVGSGEAWLTELSTEQIREIVALSPDAVAEG
jgi:non-specific serine/threonine protein kinase